MAQQKARQLNVAHAYGSVEALLAHPGLQVVHNCTPNHLHARINRQILSAGLHVFSEKPLCMTAEEARELVALAESAGWFMASALSIASLPWCSRRRR
jgi:predicted dehydrogenase